MWLANVVLWVMSTANGVLIAWALVRIIRRRHYNQESPLARVVKR